MREFIMIAVLCMLILRYSGMLGTAVQFKDMKEG